MTAAATHRKCLSISLTVAVLMLGFAQHVPPVIARSNDKLSLLEEAEGLILDFGKQVVRGEKLITKGQQLAGFISGTPFTGLLNGEIDSVINVNPASPNFGKGELRALIVVYTEDGDGAVIGTVELRLEGKISGLGLVADGKFEVASGTGIYRGLEGHGTYVAVINAEPFSDELPQPLTVSATGTYHYDD